MTKQQQIILNTYVPLIFHAQIQPKIVVLEKKLILLFLLFLVTVAIFDLTQFYNSETLESGHAQCEI